MDYITGTYALNLPCELDTFGDWHYSAIDWANVPLRNSDDSIFGERDISERTLRGETLCVANHIRAAVDLIEQGYFSSAQGMRDNYIGNDKYTPEIFDMVWQLRGNNNWAQVNDFMGKEYLCEWLAYKQGRDSK